MSLFDKPLTVLESVTQSKILEYAQRRGWWAIKVETRSIRGVMDTYCLRRGRHVWIEVKREGEGPRLQQAKRIKEVQDHGGEAYAVDSMEAAMEILR